MKRLSWISLAVLAAGFSTLAHAQLIGSVSASPSTMESTPTITAVQRALCSEATKCS